MRSACLRTFVAALALANTLSISAQETLALTGRVIDAATASGIPNLEVKITPPRATQRPIRMATTDAAGTFRVSSVSRGGNLVEVFQGIHLLYRAEIDTAKSGHVEITLRPRMTDSTLFVSALDRSGRPVLNLSAKDFVVKQGGSTREVLSASPAAGRMDVGIVVDSGAAQQTHSVRASLQSFVQSVASFASIAVMLADSGARLPDLTNDVVILRQQIGRIVPRGQITSDPLESVLEVSKTLGSREAERRAIVFIGASHTRNSSVPPHGVVDTLGRDGVQLHVVMMPAHVSADVVAVVSPVEEVIDRGTAATGGRVHYLGSVSGLSGRLAMIAAEFKNQYKVVFTAPATPPTSSARPEVRTTRAGVQTRTSQRR